MTHWNCKACTYLNPPPLRSGAPKCKMCNTPRGQHLCNLESATELSIGAGAANPDALQPVFLEPPDTLQPSVPEPTATVLRSDSKGKREREHATSARASDVDSSDERAEGIKKLKRNRRTAWAPEGAPEGSGVPQDIYGKVRAAFAAPVKRDTVVVDVSSTKEIEHYLRAIKLCGSSDMNTSVAPAAPSLATLLATGHY